MPKRDPGQLSSAFLSGPTFTADDVDIVNDRIAYYWYDEANDRYIAGTISPQDLATALSL